MKHRGVPFAFSLCALFVLAFVIRWALMPSEGCTGDLKLFCDWYQAIKTYGCSGIYENVEFVDYPPGLFLLYLLLSPVIDLLSGRLGLVTAIKLPAVLFDLAIGLLFYKLARGRLAPRWALAGTAIVLLNPMSVYDSAVYGQVDSIFTFFLLLCLAFLTTERYELAAAAFALALLMKPQAIVAGPVILFAFLEQARRRPGYWLLRLLGCLGVFAGALLLLALPFSPGGNPLWLFSLYVSTMDGYHFISMNAYNFWWAVGLHWTEDSLRLGPLTCLGWGYLLVAVGAALSGAVYFAAPPRRGRAFLSAAVFGTLFFMFCSRMHERYLYPAALFALFFWLYEARPEALALGSLLSVHSFFNQVGSLRWSGKFYALRQLIAVGGVLCAAALVIWALRRRGVSSETEETAGSFS